MPERMQNMCLFRELRKTVKVRFLVLFFCMFLNHQDLLVDMQRAWTPDEMSKSHADKAAFFKGQQQH